LAGGQHRLRCCLAGRQRRLDCTHIPAVVQPTQALYLMWNQDVTGKAAPAFADIAQLAITLRADLAAVDSQFTLADVTA
jgi:hypothetical protein